ACDAAGAPAWSHTWNDVQDGVYKTADLTGADKNTVQVSTDATIRWCTSYSGDANNAARPLSSRSEISSIDFDPSGVLSFGAGIIAMLGWQLWSRRRREDDKAA